MSISNSIVRCLEGEKSNRLRVESQTQSAGLTNKPGHLAQKAQRGHTVGDCLTSLPPLYKE